MIQLTGLKKLSGFLISSLNFIFLPCDYGLIRTLRIVDDTAERGVKLVEEYNSLLTNDEEEKQFILQVVEANRNLSQLKLRRSLL